MMKGGMKKIGVTRLRQRLRPSIHRADDQSELISPGCQGISPKVFLSRTTINPAR